VIRALRRLAATLDGPLHSTDLTDALRFVVQHHFGSIDIARDAARLPHPDLHRRWSRSLVLAEISRLHHEGVRITEGSLATHHGALLGALRTYFNSIVDARRAARVPEPAPLIAKKRQRWDEQRVVAEIEELHRSGESLASSKVPTPLLKAGKRYYGSRNDALEAAGLDPKDHQLVRSPYSEEELIGILKRLSTSTPTMGISELYESNFYLPLVRRFGSVEAALDRAKLRDWPVRVRGATMPRKLVLAAIRTREREGRATTRRAVFEEDHLLWHSAMVHFGEWRVAAEAAGVDLTSHNQRWTDERLIDELRARARAGKSLCPSDTLHEDSKLYQSAVGHFRSYRAACRSAGVDASRSK
jgi:hypothetical protein